MVSTRIANALQFDVVGGEFVVVGAGEFVDEAFEPRGALEVYELAAFDTDQVVMMRFERLSELVALFKADLEDVNDAHLAKELKRTVDARTFSEVAGFDNFAYRQRCVMGFENSKHVPAGLGEAELFVSKKRFELFHVASIRLNATDLQLEG